MAGCRTATHLSRVGRMSGRDPERAASRRQDLQDGVRAVLPQRLLVACEAVPRAARKGWPLRKRRARRAGGPVCGARRHEQECRAFVDARTRATIRHAAGARDNGQRKVAAASHGLAAVEEFLHARQAVIGRDGILLRY